MCWFLYGTIHKGCRHIFSDFDPPSPFCSCQHLADPPPPPAFPTVRADTRSKIFISKHSLKTPPFISFFSIQIYLSPIHFIL